MPFGRPTTDRHGKKLSHDGGAPMDRPIVGLSGAPPPRTAPPRSRPASASPVLNPTPRPVDEAGGNSDHAAAGHGVGNEARPAVPKSPGSGRDGGGVTIHVFDESRGVQQDFTCDLRTLLREMRYFRAFLKDVSEEVEISVHCDIAVFTWLLRYAKAPSGSKPSLGLNNCLPILISSQFLQMSNLVDDCVSFVSKHILEVAKLPLDMSCMLDDILSQIASRLNVDVLEQLAGQGKEDKNDKNEAGAKRAALVSKLYGHMLEALLGAGEGGGEGGVGRCSACGELYALAAEAELVCSRARIMVDFHGRISAQHARQRGFDVRRYVSVLRARRFTAREIYWHLWGLSTPLRCYSCQETFPAAYIGHCSYHPLAPHFEPGVNQGAYSCCSGQALRFDSTQLMRSKGCCAREHLVYPPPELAMDAGGGGGGAGGGGMAAAPSSDMTMQPEERRRVDGVMSRVRRHHALIAVPFTHAPPGGHLSGEPRGPLPRTYVSSVLDLDGGGGRGGIGASEDGSGASEDEDGDGPAGGGGAYSDLSLTSDEEDGGGAGGGGSSSDDEAWRGGRKGGAGGRAGAGTSRARAGGSRPSPSSGAGGGAAPRKRGVRRKAATTAAATAATPGVRLRPEHVESTLTEMPPRLQRAMRNELVREDDESRLATMVRQMDALRAKGQPKGQGQPPPSRRDHPEASGSGGGAGTGVGGSPAGARGVSMGFGRSSLAGIGGPFGGSPGGGKAPAGGSVGRLRPSSASRQRASSARR